MRFKRIEQITTIVIDKDVTEINDIRKIFENLLKFHVEFSITLRKFFPSTYEYKKHHFQQTRVNKIHQDKDEVDLMSFDKGTTFKIKNIKFEDILFIEAVNRREKILEGYNDVTRWDLLDFSIEIS